VVGVCCDVEGVWAIYCVEGLRVVRAVKETEGACDWGFFWEFVEEGEEAGICYLVCGWR
jgi:hypothetical protein